MLISNFNLCKSEWLELVFAKRNKEYGAYYIRQHHSEIVLKSFFIGVFGVAVVVGLIGVAIKTKPVLEGMVMVKTDPTLYVIPPAPKAQPPKPKVQAPKAAAAPAALINTTKFIPPVVTPDLVIEELPKLDQLKEPVGPVEIKNGVNGTSAGGDVDKAGTGLGAGTGTADNNDNAPYTAVEMMPQPVGGETAWSKFLQSNMRYPDKAMQDGVSGKVFVSFIVEKDGTLSNIKVERGPGYGLDEEAARVLKIAKPWKPGMQNGRPVRVKLTLPVSFTLSD